MLSLHLSTARSWRGGENQVYLLARGLGDAGQRPVVVAPPAAPLLARCGDEKIETRALRVRADLDIYGALKLAQLLRKLRPQVLHLHDGHAVLPGKIAARIAMLKNLKIVAHRRTVFKLKGKSKYGGRVDRVIAISNAVKEQLLNAGIASEKISVVYSGIDFPEPLSADAPEVLRLKQAHGIPADAFVIGHAAALTSEKRQADIITAVAEANRVSKGQLEAGAPIHLAIAGAGELQEELTQRAKALGAEKFVHFLGFQSNLRPLWGMSSMAVYASEAEGLCTALIEAQGAGLPAAVSRAGGMVEVVEDGRTGVIFSTGDTTALCQTILAFHDDDGLRRRMAENARVRARSLFSSQAMVDGIARVYRELSVR